MEREQQLNFCRRCKHKKNDLQQGIICGLTDRKAEFVNQCDDFEINDTVVAENAKVKEKVRPNKKRAEVAQLLIWAVMFVDIISIYSSFLQYKLLQQLQNNENVPFEILNSNDTREQIVGIVYLAVYITSAVVFIMWFRRAYFNLNARKKCEHTEGWAAGSWFVPVISLFRPFQIMKEMWVETS